MTAIAIIFSIYVLMNGYGWYLTTEQHKYVKDSDKKYWDQQGVLITLEESYKRGVAEGKSIERAMYDRTRIDQCYALVLDTAKEIRGKQKKARSKK